MKPLLFTLSILFSTACMSQTLPHRHLPTAVSRIEAALVNSEKGVAFTFDDYEIIKWDMNTGKPIANKEYQDLFGKPTCNVSWITSDKNLEYCIVQMHNNSGSWFINLNNFTAQPWKYQLSPFNEKGLVPFTVNNYEKGKATEEHWIFNPKDLSYNKIEGNKKEVGYTYEFDSIYSINRKSLKKGGDEYTVTNKKTSKQLPDDEKNAYLSQTTYTGGSNKQTISKINYKFEQLFLRDLELSKNKKWGEFKPGKFLEYSKKTNTIYALEHDGNQSYITTYNTESNYEFKRLIELINHNEMNAEEELILKKRLGDIEFARAMAEKESQAQNTPEKLLQRKLNNIQGTYVYNTSTKGVYYIVPGKPIYENHLVRLDALHHDTQKTSEVYETMENLENSNLYRRVKGHSKCGVCYGYGYTVTGGTTTLADLEYTTGKKLVQTTTNKSGCNHCGGCGIVPSELLDLNFLYINP